MANSPSLAMGLLMFDQVNNNEFSYQQQPSSFIRSLSNVVSPFIFDDQSDQLFQYEFDQWSTKPISDTYMKYHLEDDLASIDAFINDF
jgi:predicted patatin/cPLA2 family phospholipase